MLELKAVVGVSVDVCSGVEAELAAEVGLLSIDVDVSIKEELESSAVVEAFVVDTDKSDEELERTEDMIEL